MRYLTDQEVDDIVGQYHYGTSIGDIAHAYDITPFKVARVLFTEGYFYAKMWLNTADSTFNFFENLATKLFIVWGVFEVKGWSKFLWLVPVIGVLLLLIKLVFGRFYFNKGLATREITVANKFNKQVMSVYHGVENMKKK